MHVLSVAAVMTAATGIAIAQQGQSTSSADLYRSGTSNLGSIGSNPYSFGSSAHGQADSQGTGEQSTMSRPSSARSKSSALGDRQFGYYKNPSPREERKGNLLNRVLNKSFNKIGEKGDYDKERTYKRAKYLGMNKPSHADIDDKVAEKEGRKTDKQAKVWNRYNAGVGKVFKFRSGMSDYNKRRVNNLWKDDKKDKRTLSRAQGLSLKASRSSEETKEKKQRHADEKAKGKKGAGFLSDARLEQMGQFNSASRKEKKGYRKQGLASNQASLSGHGSSASDSDSLIGAHYG